MLDCSNFNDWENNDKWKSFPVVYLYCGWEIHKNKQATIIWVNLRRNKNNGEGIKKVDKKKMEKVSLRSS